MSVCMYVPILLQLQFLIRTTSMNAVCCVVTIADRKWEGVGVEDAYTMAVGSMYVCTYVCTFACCNGVRTYVHMYVRTYVMCTYTVCSSGSVWVFGSPKALQRSLLSMM